MRYFLFASITLHAALFATWSAQDLPGRTGGPVTLSVVINNDAIPQEKTHHRPNKPGHALTSSLAVTQDRSVASIRLTNSHISADKPVVEMPAKIAVAGSSAANPVIEPDDAPSTRQSTSRSKPGSQIVANLRHAFLPYFTYPKLARIKGWQGTVELTVNIDAQGQLTAARIVRSSGYGILDHAALNSIRQVKRR